MTLPPDPDSVEKWKSLPQNKPSRQALPPAAGGLGLSRVLLLGMLVLIIVITVVSLVTQPGAG
ncbi:MAG: hypothetical protein CUN53_02245 [Phototrophicales bacterium]|nr:MAG: hypothetical protein CUN53_02245 [Phototrophicales bacterium]